MLNHNLIDNTTNQPGLMRRLIRFYSTVLIIVITLFALLVSGVFAYKIVNDEKTQRFDLINRLRAQVYNYEQDLKNISFDLVSTSNKAKSLRDYFNLSLSDYYSQQLSIEPFLFFPKEIQRLYERYDEVFGFVVNVDPLNDTYYSDIYSKMGSKVNLMPNITEKVSFDRVLVNQDTYTSIGSIMMLIDSSKFDDTVNSVNNEVDPVVILTSDTGSIKYISLQENDKKNFPSKDKTHLSQIDSILQSKYLTTEITLVNGGKLYVATSKQNLAIEVFNNIAILLIVSALLDLVLLKLLNKTFGNYSSQVNGVLESMNIVRKGDITHRINLEDKDDEIYNISQAINETLDATNEYIEEIFKLEIQQNDVNLRALQSQINPHFLYNTLEFIRMYAVNEDKEELAEIVYNFSSLLRNNISLEKTTTLAKELEFNAKYVYLYQMRYPNRIAYSFNISEGLNQIQIPKFTIQPLIENFFVHGVDFSRVDNAIQVVAKEEDDRVIVEVADNGRNVDDCVIRDLQMKLDNQSYDFKNNKSVGLMNVHERLKMYLRNQDYKMEVFKNKNGGFSVKFSFTKERAEVNV